MAKGVCGVSHTSEPLRAVRWQRAQAVRTAPHLQPRMQLPTSSLYQKPREYSTKGIPRSLSCQLPPGAPEVPASTVPGHVVVSLVFIKSEESKMNYALLVYQRRADNLCSLEAIIKTLTYRIEPAFFTIPSFFQKYFGLSDRGFIELFFSLQQRVYCVTLNQFLMKLCIRFLT